MKSNVLKLIFILTLCSCKDQSKLQSESPYENLINFKETANPNEQSNSNEPQITFDHLSFEFENALAGEIIEHDYTFQNTGDKDLFILDTNSSCGCTVPEFETKPIKPGMSSSIKVRFDTTGKNGAQDKKVTIFANTNPNTIILNIKGDIIAND